VENFAIDWLISPNVAISVCASCQLF